MASDYEGVQAKKKSKLGETAKNKRQRSSIVSDEDIECTFTPQILHKTSIKGQREANVRNFNEFYSDAMNFQKKKEDKIEKAKEEIEG